MEPMQSSQTMKKKQGIMEHRVVAVLLNAVLFATNFLLFYFIWLYAFPEMTGILRLILCWVGAYFFTWLMAYMTKGVVRLILTIMMVAVLFTVFYYRP